jgi:quercetin dioxygenase-like cupin family protein
MVDLTKFDGYLHVDKMWGAEVWLVNTPAYCGKILVVDPGMMCSNHRHLIKSESFIILEGSPMIQLEGGRWETKAPGDCVHVPVGTWHRFGAVEAPALMLEVSSHHDDADVERRDPSGPLLPF